VHLGFRSLFALCLQHSIREREELLHFFHPIRVMDV
jgi:hypothetical protein